MKPLLSLILLLGTLPGVSAQPPPAPAPAAAPTSSLLLKSGQVVPVNGLERDGDTLMAAVQAGKVSYQVADVAQLNLPAPPELAAASDLLAKGHADQALAQIEPA